MKRFEFDNKKLMGLRVCGKDDTGRNDDLARLKVPATIGLKEGPPQKDRA